MIDKTGLERPIFNHAAVLFCKTFIHLFDRQIVYLL